MGTAHIGDTLGLAQPDFSITSSDFRTHIRRQLEASIDRVLLRVLVSGREGDLLEFTGPELCKRSVEIARKYCDAPPSAVVLLLLPHSSELFLLHLGLLLTGRLPAILAWPTNRVDPEKYQRNILHQIQSLPAAQLITLPRIAKNLEPGVPYSVTACSIHECERFESAFSIHLDVAPVEKQTSYQPDPGMPEDALFLQFSGGTTGNQKCVLITASMLVDQLNRLTHALRFTPQDGVASWLPLYHDMGLIACFWLPLWNQAPSIQFAATEWLLDPGMLFHFMSKYLATFCWLPNFAFNYLAGQKKRVDLSVNLSHVRAWINCSEPVRERSFKAFIGAFSDLGVRLDQCQASYAMAENVFAVTQTPLQKKPTCFKRMLVKGTLRDQRQVSQPLLDQNYVSSGSSLSGMSFRIRRADGELCADALPGEIEIRGESLFCGYWDKHGFHRQSLTSDGWYVTGDYGFTHHSDLYVIGRVKDIIISGGVNVFPEDIEALVNTVPGIYPGRIVAFGIDDQARGTESLAVVAEMRGDFNTSSASELELQIRRLIPSALGIPVRHVLVTPERWILKSTAGKISRRETRLRFLQELNKFEHDANPEEQVIPAAAAPNQSEPWFNPELRSLSRE
jgi:acyl-CoA synthetase (AMP-forming)/AMP-acid ligase II